MNRTPTGPVHHEQGPGGLHPISGGIGNREPPSPQDWESHKGIIERLYYREKRPLSYVRDHLQQHYGFRATPRMYKSRLKAWGLLKNAKKDDWGALAVLYDRERRAGKTTTSWSVRGKRRTIKDLQKYIRSLNLSDEQFLSQQEDDIEIPEYIVPLSDEGSDEDSNRRSTFVSKGSPSNSSTTLEFSTPTSSEGRVHSNSPSSDTFWSPISPSGTAVRAAWRTVTSEPLDHPNQPSGIFFETSQEAAMSFPTRNACDKLQRDVETMGHQIVDPVPLPQRTGSEEIESWILVNKREPGNSPDADSFDFYCSNCHQPASCHFASLDQLQPPSPQNPESRFILNPSSSFSGATQSSATWRIAPPVREKNAVWRWPSLCFLACFAMRRGDEHAAQPILLEAASEFERMLIAQEPLVLMCAHHVTTILALHGQNDTSKTIVQNALTVAERQLGSSHPIVNFMTYLCLIANNSEALHGSVITTQKMRETYEQLAEMYGPRHPYAVQSLFAYGWVARYFGNNLLLSEEILEKAYEESVALFGTRHMQSTFVLAALLGNDALMGKHEEAIKKMAIVIENAGSVLGLSHPYRLEAVRRLAKMMLANEEREAEAVVIPGSQIEDMYREVLWGRCRTLGRTHSYTREMRDDFEEICIRRGTWPSRQEQVEKLLSGQLHLGSTWQPQEPRKNPEEDISLEEAF